MALEMGFRTAEFLISDAPGFRSRDVGTVVGGAAPGLPAGRLLGKVTAGAATAAAQAGNTGNATSSAVTTGANVQPGVYKVEFIAATQFLVIAPDGSIVGDGATGSAFSTGGHLTFTITAGGTPMVAGDGFNITVAAGNGTYVGWASNLTNGAAKIAGILYAPQIGTGEATIVARDAVVNYAHLTHSGEKDDVIAGLLALGIVTREE
jgi:hypothetical protein